MAAAALMASLSLPQELAVLLQSRVSEVLHVDIHPAAKIGRGILMDHATGIVIGETAVVGDNVSLLHQVTLGGSGTGKGVRHPHIGAPHQFALQFQKVAGSSYASSPSDPVSPSIY